MDSHTEQGTPGMNSLLHHFNIRHNNLIPNGHVTYKEIFATFNNSYGTYRKNHETLL